MSSTLRPVNQPDDNAPAAKSHGGLSVGQLAAEVGAQELRNAGYEISPKATAQLASLFDVIAKSAVSAAASASSQAQAPRPVEPAPRMSRAALVISVVTGLGLMLAIMIGSAIAWRLFDRLESIDATGRERVAQIEARVAITERDTAELKAGEKTRDKVISDIEAKRGLLEQRVVTLEDRQMALIVYMVININKLLEKQGIRPDVPPVLKIAAAEHEDEERKRRVLKESE